MEKQYPHPLLCALLAISAIASFVFFPGCATIFNGTSQQVQFASEPSGAEIMVGGVERGETPTSITLKKPGLNEKRVTFVKEGYEDRTIVLQKDFASASILNIFGPTVVGFGIDALSGALYNYGPAQYSVEFEKEGTSSRSSSKQTWFSLQELERDEVGNLVIPEREHAVSIVDSKTGTVYTFR